MKKCKLCSGLEKGLRDARKELEKINIKQEIGEAMSCAGLAHYIIGITLIDHVHKLMGCTPVQTEEKLSPTQERDLKRLINKFFAENLNSKALASCQLEDGEKKAEG